MTRDQDKADVAENAAFDQGKVDDPVRCRRIIMMVLNLPAEKNRIC